MRNDAFLSNVSSDITQKTHIKNVNFLTKLRLKKLEEDFVAQLDPNKKNFLSNTN